jgi:hypothetical protein
MTFGIQLPTLLQMLMMQTIMEHKLSQFMDVFLWQTPMTWDISMGTLMVAFQ